MIQANIRACTIEIRLIFIIDSFLPGADYWNGNSDVKQFQTIILMKQYQPRGVNANQREMCISILAMVLLKVLQGLIVICMITVPIACKSR